MKLIITGACGHIGSYVAERMHLIPKIKKTILIDSLESNRHCSLFNISTKNNLSFFQIDVSKKKSLDNFKDADYLIHCASMTNAEKSFSKEKEMYKNNLDCMNNVINFCKKNRVKLIHLSSTSVYGKQSDLVDEKCEKKYLKPQSPYAKIKLIEENILQDENTTKNHIKILLNKKIEVEEIMFDFYFANPLPRKVNELSNNQSFLWIDTCARIQTFKNINSVNLESYCALAGTKNKESFKIYNDLEKLDKNQIFQFFNNSNQSFFKMK